MKTIKIAGLVLGVMVLAGTLLKALDGAAAPGVGQTGRIVAGAKYDGAWMAFRGGDYELMTQAEDRAARGGKGAGADLYQMAAKGLVRIIGAGTSVKVLESGIDSRKVEILDGEDRGKTGWIRAKGVR